ncbi:hypothetical protein DFH06DRAFT_1163190 [Mycena polygramma]|nr:hypothetical protein DFH06DRAFT_1163190 [Mycena polygramma]
MTMFTFTKTSVCLLFALLTFKGVQGAPIPMDIQGVESLIQSALGNHQDQGMFSECPVSILMLWIASSSTGTDLASQSGSASANSLSIPSASGVLTIVSSAGGSAITLAHSGTPTVWGGATYTVDVNGAAATSISSDTNSASTSGSASVSASKSSASSVGSSGGSSNAPSSAQSLSGSSSSSSPSSTTNPNGSTRLRPAHVTPLARGLFTVAAGIVFGALCL